MQRTVLVVDDDAAIRRLLHDTLDEAGYLVVEAANGAAAIEVLRRTAVEVMITDLVMPEKEGLETIGEVRKNFPHVKIISMSGAFGGHYLKASTLLGADAMIAKPIDADKLLTTLRDLA